VNKHEYIGWTIDDPTSRHIVGGPLTGWIFSDTNRQVKCPLCNSDPGYYCETPTGRKVKGGVPHSERVQEFTKWKNELEY